MLPEIMAQRTSYGRIVGVVSMYWMVSISLVFTNKYILSGSFGDQELTIFAAWYQSMAAVGFILCLGVSNTSCGFRLKIPKVDFRQLLSKTMLMLSMSSVCSMTFNNLMLKNIGVAFYQVARSFTIIFTIVLTSVMLQKRVTGRAVLACLLVVIGFFIGIDQEDVSGTLSVFGVLYGLLASFTAAVSGILFKRAETTVDNDSLKMAYYNNLNCAVMFIPLVIGSGQLSAVFQSTFIYSFKFWLILTITGGLSLCIGWVSALQIKYTSPIAHHLSINAKSVVQTVLAVLFYKETKTFYWWLGNALVVTGVLWYTFTKMFESSSSDNTEIIIPPPKNSKNKPHSNGEV